MASASYQHNAGGERVMKTSLIGNASLIGEELLRNCPAVEGRSVQTFGYDEAGRVIADRNGPGSDGPPTNFEFVWLDEQSRAINNVAGFVTWTWIAVTGNQVRGGSNALEVPVRA
jgi:hypothetical protein